MIVHHLKDIGTRFHLETRVEVPRLHGTGAIYVLERKARPMIRSGTTICAGIMKTNFEPQ